MEGSGGADTPDGRRDRALRRPDRPRRSRRRTLKMARFRLFIEYEGTRYSGWQVQKNARTVQGELLGAARGVFQSAEVEIYGSGRTDAGVHALCQIAHLDVKTM